MRICILVPKFYPSLGGVERCILEILKRLSSKHDFFVFTSNLFYFEPKITLKKEKEKILNNVYIFRFPVYRTLPLPYGLTYNSLSMLLNLIKNKSFDIIHSFSYGFFTTYYGSFLKRLRKIKHITTTNSDPGRKTIKKLIFDHFNSKFSLITDKIIAVTKIEKNHLISIGIPKEKIEIIPNGVNIKEFSKKEEKIREIKDIDYILFCGKIDISIKGLDTLIKAFSIFSKEYREIKLVICGFYSSETREIIKIINKLNLKDKVLLFYNFYGKRLLSLYQNCLFLVLPSNIEAFGMVILEAFASKKTVIASNVGGIPEIVKNYYNGLIFKPRNHLELAKKMIELTKDKNLRKKFEENSFKTALKYDWNLIVEKIEKVYKTI